ncbi:hypothetical protein SKA58_05360 [Sphingomonas sp. SKA58]|nr:hypothetical protein SKA58_05360 [Sphingomonas sp. SKA58]
MHHVAAGFGTDADPVDAGMGGQGAVAFDRDGEAPIMQRIDQGVVHLQHRLPAGQHDIAAFRPFPPEAKRGVGQSLGIGELAAAKAIGADEVRIAKAADGAGAILFATAPQIAAGKAQEHRAPPRLHPFALERQEHLLDRIAHRLGLGRLHGIDGGIGQARFLIALGAQPAAVAQSAMLAIGRGIIAGPADPGVQAQSIGLARDVRLGHILQRGVDADRMPLHPRLGGERRHLLESVDKFGPAIGIARVIERIDADEDVARPRDLRQPQCQRQEDRVARWHIGDGDVAAHPTLGHGYVGRQRRSAKGGEVERQDDVTDRVERLRHARGGAQFDAMALVIVDRQREEAITRLARQRTRHHRIETARQQDDGKFFLSGNHRAPLRLPTHQRKRSRLPSRCAGQRLQGPRRRASASKAKGAPSATPCDRICTRRSVSTRRSVRPLPAAAQS